MRPKAADTASSGAFIRDSGRITETKNGDAVPTYIHKSGFIALHQADEQMDIQDEQSIFI